MKLILFVALVCISLNVVSLQQHQSDPNLKRNVRKLQIRVEQLFKCLKQRNFESCPEALPDIDQSLTEQYLLIRAANESFLDNKGNMDRKERCEREYDFGYKNALFEARQVVKNISIHVVKDFGHLCSLDLHDALQWFIYYFLRTLKMWNTKNIVLNVTYVEQKQMEIVTERGQMQYEFMRDDYNECLDLFATDLLKALHPTMSAIVSPNSIPIISRMIKMYKILYGNRKEIETGLAYLYDNASV